MILRLRGDEDAGGTFIDVIDRYAATLVLVADDPRLLRRLRLADVLAGLGEESVYRGDEWVGRTVRRAYRDAQAWMAEQGG